MQENHNTSVSHIVVQTTKYILTGSSLNLNAYNKL